MAGSGRTSNSEPETCFLNDEIPEENTTGKLSESSCFPTLG